MPADIGRVGIWGFSGRGLEESELRDVLSELEEAGWGAVWFGGSAAGGSIRVARKLLDHSRRMTVATGIVSIFASDPAETAALNRALVADHPGRFLLGLGVSHPEPVNAQTPGRWEKPLAAMRAFLDAADAADPGGDPAQRVLAALGPQMLRLSGSRAGGAHPYFVPVEHTAAAREVLGPGPLLAPEQMVVLESDPDRARQIARAGIQMYLGLSNYTNNLRRFGFGDDDLSEGGSDRLVDAIVAWGDPDAIAERVRAHLDAGADHVAIQVLTTEPGSVPREAWHMLAESLL
jgi:probable F420-dependent oxidoreductase